MKKEVCKETAINVCCRFRPKNEREIKEEKNNKQFYFLSPTSILIKNENKEHEFFFDSIFSEQTTQEQIYNEKILPLLDELFAGYSCTIFAYGQTGSGKTFTLSGEETEIENNNQGIIPRVITDLFKKISFQQSEIEYSLSVCYIELYLEQIRDLLSPASTELKLREGGKMNGFWIQGVREEYVVSKEELENLIASGTKQRIIASTKMNECSSRSHSVLILTLQQSFLLKGTKYSSKLCLVDLAGSEKVSKTGASGILLKQAQATNKSLSTLGNVIKALSDKAEHIPYRDSKLTKLLMDSLGGTSKTCLIITCSPSVWNIEETLSTLRFGSRAKTIKNKAIANIEYCSSEYQRMLESASIRIKQLEILKGSEEKIELEKYKKLEEERKREREEYEEKIDIIQTRLEEGVLLLEELESENNILKKQNEEKDKKIVELKNELLSVKNSSSLYTIDEFSNYDKHVSKSRETMIQELENALTSSELSRKIEKEAYEKSISIIKSQLSNLKLELYTPMIKKKIIK